MKKLIPLALLIILSISFNPLQAQINPELADGFQEILDYTTDGGLNGVSVTVILPDGCSWTGVSGEAGPGDPVDLDRKWHFASTTKAMTACILLQLHEEGTVDINDPISMYMNTDTLNYVDPEITLKMLMNQTTDLTRIWDNDPATALWDAVWADPDSIWNIWDVLDYTLPPTPNPNLEHRYLGLINYLLLGMVIEEATGNPLAYEFQNRIFDPLGMEESYLGIDGIDMSTINGCWNEDYYEGNQPMNAYLSTRGAAAWLISSTHDVATFIRAFHHDELVSADLMAEARTITPGDPIIAPGSCKGSGEVYYGYGTHILKYTSTSGNVETFLYGHGGQGLGNSLTFHLMENDLTISVACNDYSLSGALKTDNLMRDLFCHTLYNLEIADCLTSVSENELEGVAVYPNPGTNELFVEMGETHGQELVQLISGSGQVLAEAVPRGNRVYFNTANLVNGIYFVKTISSVGVTTLKWVKKQ